MFGQIFHIETEKVSIVLRPIQSSDLQLIAEGVSNPLVSLYTLQRYGLALENELDWFNKIRLANDTLVWAIQPADQQVPIGVTALHNLSFTEGTCESGIVIFDPSWWRKGVATAAHYGRIFALTHDFGGINLIHTKVFTENEGSWRALERVGYYRMPIPQYGTCYRNGCYRHSYHLTWFRPDRISCIFPEGVPPECEEAVARAEEALEKAKKFVKLGKSHPVSSEAR